MMPTVIETVFIVDEHVPNQSRSNRFALGCDVFDTTRHLQEAALS